MKSKGLSFADETKALHTLQHVSYSFMSTPCRNTRVYYVLCIIRYLLATINPNTTFPIKLKSLLAEFPQVNVSAMGFPAGWEKEALWK